MEKFLADGTIIGLTSMVAADRGARRRSTSAAARP
jgi:hypothetical protein